MLKRLVPALVLALALTSAVALALPQQAQVAQPSVVAHEWGTFTTVAGQDGRPVDWLPLGGPSDLPCFVERYQNGLIKGLFLSPEVEGPIEYDRARAALWGKVRMETPVIYFYADRAAAVDVTVRFPRGLMTEWYPSAFVRQPTAFENTLYQPATTSIIQWRDVRLNPAAQPALPVTPGKSHYYAARETDATPVRVFDQVEKFLFYRGVANFDVPLSAVALDDGTVRVKNVGSAPIPAVIVFENRGGKLGFRTSGPLRDGVALELPELKSSFEALRADLERTLVEAGLFAKEARAMIETWRDSWFEEGLRVFYLVPAASVDAILPLTIDPAPAQVARVFVGRMDLVTPEDELAVASAIARSDLPALERRGRLLGPIIDRLLAQPDLPNRAKTRVLANLVLGSYVDRAASCN